MSRLRESTGFHQSSGKKENQHYSKRHELLVCCWEQSKLPSDLCDAIIDTLYKNKGEKSDCSNYREFSLLSIAGKILNRLVPTITEDDLPETQCGFRANRSITDMVFVLRKFEEKYRDQNKGLYIAFVDLTKAFDTVSRKGLWMIMEHLGYPIQSSSTWLSNCTKTSGAKLGWTAISLDPSLH